MGLFLCELCGQSVSENHVCDREDIRKRMEELHATINRTTRELSAVRNGVEMLLQGLPSLEGKTTTVDTDWLRSLWSASGCLVRDVVGSADCFVSRQSVLHKVLRHSYDVFRSRKKESLLVKLRGLKRVCEESKEILGYQDSILDMSPEELMK